MLENIARSISSGNTEIASSEGETLISSATSLLSHLTRLSLGMVSEALDPEPAAAAVGFLNLYLGVGCGGLIPCYMDALQTPLFSWVEERWLNMWFC